MKITDVECIRVEIPIPGGFLTTHSKKPIESFQEYLFKIHTDENITGFGSSWYHRFIPNWEKYFEKKVKTFVSGKKINQNFIEEYVDKSRNFSTDCNIYSRASGIEIALWHILGKKDNLPIYKLHEASVDKLKAYASVLESYPLLTTEEWIKFVNKIHKDGFKAIKLHFTTNFQKVDYIIDIIRAIRNELGDTIEIMLDFMQSRSNKTINYSDIVSLINNLEKYNIRWIEEPLPDILNIKSYKKLCKKVNIPIASGGKIYSTKDCFKLLKENAIDIIQPDIQHVGGILEIKKIAMLAKKYNKKCILHFFGTGIALAASLHACSIINSPFIEFPYQPPFLTPKTLCATIKKTIKIDKKGFVKLPDSPGLGIELANS